MEKKLKHECFRVFSNPLKNFIMSKGIPYLCVGLDSKSKKTFWAFYLDEELKDVLKIWSDTKPQRM